MLKRAFLLIALASLAACSPPKDKKTYKLSDAANHWHRYKDGEYAQFQFLALNGDGSSFSGNWTMRWRAINLSPSPAGVTAALTVESTAITPYGGIPAPASLYYFIQNDQGAMTLYGVEKEGTNKINFVRTGSTMGVPLFASPLTTSSAQQSTSFSLDTCTTSPFSCTTDNGQGAVWYTVTGVETVETPMAFFECYRVSVYQNFVVGSSITPHLNGSACIYPALGMVQASSDAFDSTTLLPVHYQQIAITDTNIALP